MMIIRGVMFIQLNRYGGFLAKYQLENLKTDNPG
jgi:hypothetical protein